MHYCSVTVVNYAQYFIEIAAVKVQHFFSVFICCSFRKHFVSAVSHRALITNFSVYYRSPLGNESFKVTHSGYLRPPSDQIIRKKNNPSISLKNESGWNGRERGISFFVCFQCNVSKNSLRLFSLFRVQ